MIRFDNKRNYQHNATLHSAAPPSAGSTLCEEEQLYFVVSVISLYLFIFLSDNLSFNRIIILILNVFQIICVTSQ